MKQVFALLLLALAPAAQALDLPAAPAARSFELMKCNSMKQGTLWASFGHLMRSDSPDITYFPTEIVVFAPDLSSRLLFPSFKDGLKIPVRVSPKSFAFQFDVPNGASVRTHRLTLVTSDLLDAHSFMGNWAVSELGKNDIMDQVACTVH